MNLEELFKIGISEKTIRNMIELNSNIKKMTNKEIKEKIEILKQVNCSDTQILNIISSNALYLDKTNTEIISLIKYLINLGFDSINLLFDSNPYILNLEPFEIDNYINKRKINGEKLEDIIDDLDSNPYLFIEM